jgi:hypothetical protein
MEADCTGLGSTGGKLLGVEGEVDEGGRLDEEMHEEREAW